MSDKVYARVENGAVVEYPVLPIHIENRGQPLDWYTEVQFAAKPEVPEFFSLKETLTVKGSEVFASYEVVAIPLDTILGNLWSVGDILDPNPANVVIGDVPQATIERVTQLARDQAQKELDDFAKEKMYDGILSACSYSTSTNSAFGAEGQRAVQVRDSYWSGLYGYLDNVKAGVNPVPKGWKDIKDQLPPLAW
jgi:hypothetical protein